MIFFKNLYAAAIPAGPIVSVLSALTAEQITLGVESLTNTINNAESTANSVTLATGDLETQTLVNNNNKIASDITTLDEASLGSAKLTTTQQKALVDTLSTYSNSLASLFTTFGGKADDFEVNPDQARIQDSADSIRKVNDGLLDDLTMLGHVLAVQIPNLRHADDEADENMDNDFANSPLRRRRVFTV